MRTCALVMFVVALAFACLAGPVPAEAARFTNTVAATDVFTPAGVNASAYTISHLGVANLSAADVSGNGSLAGTILINERGLPGSSQQLPGNYTLGSNCFITIRVHELVGSTLRLDALLGFVSENGGTIIFGSPFDPAVQLAGVPPERSNEHLDLPRVHSGHDVPPGDVGRLPGYVYLGQQRRFPGRVGPSLVEVDAETAKTLTSTTGRGDVYAFTSGSRRL